MSNFEPFLERNRAFAETEAYKGLVIRPRHPLFVLTCQDPRLDPAALLGIELGDALVVRNAGGRVSEEVINNVAYMGYLGEMMQADGPLFEVAVIHHNQCGTGFLADEEFRHKFAQQTGLDEQELAGQAVVEPEASVRADVERLLGSPRVSPRITVSGHVYDVDTGLVTTVVAAAHPPAA
jgi:carbonic anhydrase